MPITIEKMNETTFKVTVADRTVTTHLVTVAPEYWQKLGWHCLGGEAG
jgi:hypothetical protein